MNKQVTINGGLLAKVLWIASFVVLAYTFLVGADVFSPTNDWFSYSATLALGLALAALGTVVKPGGQG